MYVVDLSQSTENSSTSTQTGASGRLRPAGPRNAPITRNPITKNTIIAISHTPAHPTTPAVCRSVCTYSLCTADSVSVGSIRAGHAVEYVDVSMKYVFAGNANPVTHFFHDGPYSNPHLRIDRSQTLSGAG